MKPFPIPTVNRPACWAVSVFLVAAVGLVQPSFSQEVIVDFNDLEVADGATHQLSEYSHSGITFRMEGAPEGDGIWYVGQGNPGYQGSAGIYVRGGELVIEAPPGRTLTTGAQEIVFAYADLCGFGEPNPYGGCAIPGTDTVINVSLWAEDGSQVGVMTNEPLPGAFGFQWFGIPLGYSSSTVHRIAINTADRRQFDNFNFVLGGGEPPGDDPDISAVPISLGFGEVIVGSSAQLDLVVTNEGNAALQIGAVGVSNGLSPPFSFGSDACFGSLIPPQGSCTITVSFQPTIHGVSLDSFDIPSNDPDTPTLTISVSGSGIVSPTLGGNVLGIAVHTVNCQNKSTKQKVSIAMQDGQTAWDCEAAGLVVNPGDQIDMTVKGFAE